MRVSTRQDDSGYAEALREGVDLLRIKVFLDGVPQRFCITADSDVGLVVRYVLDASGHTLVDPLTGDMRTEIAYGVVTFGDANRTDPAHG